MQLCIKTVMHLQCRARARVTESPCRKREDGPAGDTSRNDPKARKQPARRNGNRRGCQLHCWVEDRKFRRTRAAPAPLDDPTDHWNQFAGGKLVSTMRTR